MLIWKNIDITVTSDIFSEVTNSNQKAETNTIVLTSVEFNCTIVSRLDTIG